MYAKLALRNVKKSSKDYVIYMVTLTLCVGLFYSFMSICSKYYVSTLPVEYDLKLLQMLMRYPVIAITALLLFLVMYVNNFMLKRRQKEFAIQILLGMEQRNAAFLFFIETIIMGIISIVLGIILGMFFSQLLSSIVMNFFKEEYHMYFSLFPDTVLITISGFTTAFLLIGIFNIRKIRKLKIINMLRAEKELQNDIKKEILMPFMVLVVALLSFFVSDFNRKVYKTCRSLIAGGDLTGFDVFIIYANLILPAVCCGIIGMYIILCLRKHRLIFFQRFIILLAGLTTLIIFSFLSVVNGHPKVDSSIENRYFIYACAYLVFLMFIIFYTLSSLMQIFKEKSKTLKYKGNTMFLLGQITGKLRSASRTMSVLAGAFLLAFTVFIIDPILSGWAVGYLDKRAVFDIQINSDYNSHSTINTLPNRDFSYAEAVRKELAIELSDSAIVEMYFMKKEYFIPGSTNQPVLIMALSDYNHIRSMAGYEEIQLREDEFTAQWHFSADESYIEKYLDKYRTITVNHTLLKQAKDMRHADQLGEMIYNSSQNVVFIVPDLVCKDLLIGKCNYFGKTLNKLSFEKANKFTQKINKILENSNGNNNFHTELRMRTLQRNDGISAALVMKLMLFYGGVVLLIICFTILSLQQLADSYDFKHRFRTIRKMGVTDSAINKIVIAQMCIWFGLPLIVAGISAWITGHYYIKKTRIFIDLFIGIDNFYSSITKMFFVIGTILICYFISTWILFKKNIEQA